MKTLFFALISMFYFLSVLIAADSEIKKPNILFILTDDQRWDSLGCYGNRSIRTPNLDRLAAQGVLLNGFFTTAPLCCPSRAVFLTGKYPHQLGIYTNNGPFDFRGSQMVAHYLNSAGYLTGFIGKAHVGGHPDKWGFKHTPIVSPGLGEEADPKLSIHGEKKVVKGNITEILANGAINFIREHKNERWFLWFASTSPHWPYRMFPDHPYQREDIQPPPGWPPFQEFERGRNWDNYYSTISALDEQIGRILKTLDELQLTDDTFIFFTSDHGFMKGSHQVAAKWSWFDESIRLPAIVKWPGKISPNTKISTLFSNVDFLPTLLDVAHVPKPQTLAGQSMIPALTGRQVSSLPVFGELKGKGPISSGLWQMIRTEQWKYVRADKDQKWEEYLFHLAKDPFEGKDVSKSDENKGVLADLRNRMETWLQQTPPVIPLVNKEQKRKKE